MIKHPIFRKRLFPFPYIVQATVLWILLFSFNHHTALDVLHLREFVSFCFWSENSYRNNSDNVTQVSKKYICHVNM